MTKSELLLRTKKFALDIIKFTDSLPKSSSLKIISNQLVRAATSIGANYRAALRGKSKADFLYKIRIVEEEADETLYWLELINESNIESFEQIKNLLDEANQLTAIFTQIAKTSKKNIVYHNSRNSNLNS